MIFFLSSFHVGSTDYCTFNETINFLKGIIMKYVLLALVMSASVSAFAADKAAPAAATEKAATTEMAAPAKMNKKAASKACKAEHKKGAELKACIKEKTA